MPDPFEIRCRKLVEDLGLATQDQVISVRPLNGGVASDIGVVDLGNRRVCVKFALEKLKVQEDWYAPLHRNKAEYLWLEFAATIVPNAVPQLYGRSETENGFAMAYLPPEMAHNWKEALLQDTQPEAEALAVGQTVGKIHAASSTSAFNRTGFENADDFHALRIEPYLFFTASRHPDLSRPLEQLATDLHSSDQALIHGDISPKNILISSGQPIFLDAECATMGDPGFDVAFCLNHLILKAVHLPHMRSALLKAVTELWSGYRPHICWEDEAALESRICRLLPALMLARVDGKSPAEYLDMQSRDFIRLLSRPLIAQPVANLTALISKIQTASGT